MDGTVKDLYRESSTPVQCRTSRRSPASTVWPAAVEAGAPQARVKRAPAAYKHGLVVVAVAIVVVATVKQK